MRELNFNFRFSEEQVSKEEIPVEVPATAPNASTPEDTPISDDPNAANAALLATVVDPDEPKGDPEMVPVYVKSLLPLFCRTYQSTMITSVKKSSLNLIKKMIYYLTSDLLQEVCVENSAIVGKYTCNLSNNPVAEPYNQIDFTWTFQTNAKCNNINDG